jgi:hypothetical protein
LTREQIVAALQALSDDSANKASLGKSVYGGGTVMLLAFSANLARRDVDALFQPAQVIRDRVRDAYLGATAEELAHHCQFPTRDWVVAETRKLHRPWFASPLAALRAVLLLESPAAFRSRNLLFSQNALTRA